MRRRPKAAAARATPPTPAGEAGRKTLRGTKAEGKGGPSGATPDADDGLTRLRHFEESGIGREPNGLPRYSLRASRAAEYHLE